MSLKYDIIIMIIINESWECDKTECRD